MAENVKQIPAQISKIKELMPTLSKAEQLVAQYMIDNPDQIVNLSVAALAECVGVSDPTVVRACQKLGFSGYQDLKITLVQSLVSPLKIIHEEVTPEDDMQKLVGKVFKSTISTLQYTFGTIATQDMERAAQMLMNARRILIFGIGASGPIAMDLQHKLQRLNLYANAMTDAHIQCLNAAYVSEEDVVFAVSHSGSSRVITDNVKIAKENGAKIISMTNLGRSPLSKLADVSLYTASKETQFRILAISSRIAELAIIDSIYTYIALRTDALSDMKVEKAMEGFKY